MGPDSTEVSGTVRGICDVLWRDERWGRRRENTPVHSERFGRGREKEVAP